MAGERVELIIAARNQADKALNEVKGGLQGLGKSVLSLKGALAGLGAALTVGALTRMVTATLDGADAMAKLSQSTGVAVETLTAYRHAANLSGTSIEGVAEGLNRLAMNMAATARGTGQAKAAFAALGIAATDADGSLRQTDAVLMDIADRFAAMEDGTAKSALAMELFGRSGTQLIPLLNQGAAGLQAMKDEAARLGLVLDAEAAAAAERVNDNLTRMQGALQGARNGLVLGLLPTLENLSDMLTTVTGDQQAMATASKTLSAGLKLVASVAVVVWNVFKSVGDRLGALAAAAYELAQGNFRNAFHIVKAHAADTVDQAKGTWNTLKEIWQDGGDSAERSGRRIARGFEPAAAAAKPVAEAADKIRAVLAALEHERDQLGRSNVEQRLHNELRTAGIGVNHAAAASIAALVEQIEAETAALRARQQAEAEGAAARDALRRMVTGLLSPAEQLQSQLEERRRIIEEALAKEYITADEAKQALLLLEEDHQKRLAEIYSDWPQQLEPALKEMNQLAVQASRSIQSHFADFLFDPFNQGLQGMLTGFVNTVRRMLAEAVALQALTGLFKSMAGSSSGLLSSMGSSLLSGLTASAKGNVFAGGRLVPFALGGVVGKPTFFPMADGNTGLMGEAGPEAIMPLKRGPDGKLGVAAGGAGNGETLGLLRELLAATRQQKGTRVVNVLDPSVVEDWANSSSGEKVVMNLISRNAGQVRQLIGG